VPEPHLHPDWIADHLGGEQVIRVADPDDAPAFEAVLVASPTGRADRHHRLRILLDQYETRRRGRREAEQQRGRTRHKRTLNHWRANDIVVVPARSELAMKFAVTLVCLAAVSLQGQGQPPTVRTTSS